MTDFSKPQRMSIGAFFVMLSKILQSLIGFAFFTIIYGLINTGFSLTDHTLWIKILSSIGGIIILSILIAFAAYYPKKFYIQDKKLVFNYGIATRRNTTIPLDKIHSLRTNRGIWYRLLDMRGIVFDTLASKGSEIELILGESDWISLKRLISQEERPIQASENEPPPFNPTFKRNFANVNLLKDALCQNHLKAFAVLIGFIALMTEKVFDIFQVNLESITDYTFTHIDQFIISPFGVLIILIAIYVILVILSVGKILIRYYDMSLTFDNKFLSFSYGLISRSSSRFSFDKICTLWTKRNFLEQKYGLCTLILRQASNVGSLKDDDKLKLYGSDSSHFFLSWWLGKTYRESVEIMSAKSGKGVIVHCVLPWISISLAASAMLFYYQEYVYLFIPALCILYSLVKGILAMRRSNIILYDSYLKISNGCFAKEYNYPKYGNIEVTTIKCTPFTKFFHRVTLIISTPGTTFRIRSLPEQEAKLIYESILNRQLHRDSSILRID